jgi:hypothetical protein
MHLRIGMDISWYNPKGQSCLGLESIFMNFHAQWRPLFDVSWRPQSVCRYHCDTQDLASQIGDKQSLELRRFAPKMIQYMCVRFTKKYHIYIHIYIYIWQYTHVSCPSYLQHPSWVFHHQSGPPSIDKCWWNHQQDGLVWELDTVPIKPWITTSFSHWHEPKMGPWGWDSPNVISSCGQFYYPIWFMFPGLSCSVKSELVYPIYIQFVVKYIPYYIYIHIYIIIYVFVHLFIYSVS